MAHGPHARPPLSNRKTRLLIIIVGVVVFAAVSLVTYNRVTMERARAAQQQPLPTPAPVQAAEQYPFVKEGELTFIAKNGNMISRIDLEIADTDASRAQGLMYRSKMAETEGMIFVFSDEDLRSFWMKNTRISLDMIFITARGEIITILTNTTPLDESTYNSTAPAMYVVEVNAGYTQKYHINVGDGIRWTRL